MIENKFSTEHIKNYNVDLLESYCLLEGVNYKYIKSHVETYLKETEQVIFFGWSDFINIEQFVKFINHCDDNVCIYCNCKIGLKPHIYIITSRRTRFQKINRIKTLINEKKCLYRN